MYQAEAFLTGSGSDELSLGEYSSPVTIYASRAGRKHVQLSWGGHSGPRDGVGSIQLSLSGYRYPWAGTAALGRVHLSFITQSIQETVSALKDEQLATSALPPEDEIHGTRIFGIVPEHYSLRYTNTNPGGFNQSDVCATTPPADSVSHRQSFALPTPEITNASTQPPTPQRFKAPITLSYDARTVIFRNSSETAAVLMRAMDMLHHQTSSGQHALLCANERRCALQHLLATVETAAKLAEVALAAEHNAAGSDTDCISAETERLQAEGVKIGREVERAVVETARIKAEVQKVGMEVERAVQETGRIKAESVKVGKQTEKVCREIEMAARETLRLKVEAEKVRAEVDREAQKTERARVEGQSVQREVERWAGEVQGGTTVVEKTYSNSEYFQSLLSPFCFRRQRHYHHSLLHRQLYRHQSVLPLELYRHQSLLPQYLYRPKSLLPQQLYRHQSLFPSSSTNTGPFPPTSCNFT
ncbi:hypothetical protein DFP73DRAFT_588787 [Morchella snyderi]|nr:hypothetical protein DFP73DRAFT_588787 [Morchella snyderi]